MIKYLIAFILISTPCFAGMGIGGFPYPGPGPGAVASGGSTWVGNASVGNTSMGNTIEYTYYHKLQATPTLSGTLTKYKVTLSEPGADGRTLKACLYTHNTGTNRPDVQISGSCTATTDFVGYSAGQDLDLTPLGSALVMSGATYWVGLRTDGYATIMGTDSAEPYYSIFYGPQTTYSGTERVHAGTAGKLQIEVTP